jgi:ribA/ribD-fused uncharacterized protein
MPKSGIYGFSGKFRWLSNFADCEVVDYMGITYPTTENAYQAAKFKFKDTRLKFVDMTPAAAKHAGKEWKHLMRNDWHDVSLGIMKDLNKQKFQQEPYKALLLNTDGLYIEETNTWGDTFWGVCMGNGENHLGLILMEIREELLRATRP